jgi:hypothetical protein
MLFCSPTENVGLSTQLRFATGPVMPQTQEPAALREKAAKCRRLANGMSDDQAIAALRRLADAYEHRAAELEASAPSRDDGS